MEHCPNFCDLTVGQRVYDQFVICHKLCTERCAGSLVRLLTDSKVFHSIFIYLFGVLRRFQHCTGHITTGSWKGRGNQYI